MIIAGYEDTLIIEEMKGYDVDAVKSLIEKAKEIALEHGRSRITVNHAIPDSLVSTVLIELGASITMSTPQHFMLKILNPYELLRNNVELFEKQIQSSQYAKDSFRFTLAIGSIHIGVRVETGVPELLKPYWHSDFYSFHSPEWWKKLWDKTGLVEITYSGLIEENDEIWDTWLNCGHEFGKEDRKFIEADVEKDLYL